MKLYCAVIRPDPVESETEGYTDKREMNGVRDRHDCELCLIVPNRYNTAGFENGEKKL